MAHVLVPMAQGCEDLETVTIIDILRRAEIKVTTAGLDNKPVIGSRGTTFIPDTILECVLEEDFDLIALPGGLPGADNLNNDPRIHQILKRNIENKRHVAAICAAPKVLSSAGLLDGKQATSFTGVLKNQQNPKIKIQTQAVVQDDLIITSQSAGTAMDFALALVGVLAGPEKQAEIDKQLLRTKVN